MSNDDTAVSALRAALRVAIQMLIRAQNLASLIEGARTEGREPSTDEILVACASEDEASQRAVSELLAMIPADFIVDKTMRPPSIGDLMAAASRQQTPVFRLDESI